MEILQSADQSLESGRGGLEINREGIRQWTEFQAVKRLANISSIVEDAADQLADKEVTDHKPDPEWNARYFGHVPDVSSEELRKMWAKVLAGEIQNPGQTSLRTLDILRNLTIDDAKKFTDLCAFVLDYTFVFYERGTSDDNFPSYGELLHLQDCGLLTLGTHLRFNINFVEDGYSVLKQQSGYLMIVDEQLNGTLPVPSIRLTAAGSEFSRVIESNLDSDYLRTFAIFLAEKNYGLRRLEGAVYDPDEQTITMGRAVPIEPQ